MHHACQILTQSDSGAVRIGVTRKGGGERGHHRGGDTLMKF